MSEPLLTQKTLPQNAPVPELAIELQGVTKVFKQNFWQRRQAAVQDLSCSFESRRCTGLLGHNGAGKTTAIRMILGLTRPDAGHILFEGQPLAVINKRYIGYMPEVNKLARALTPSEILRHQLALFLPQSFATKKQRGDAIDAKLEEVGLLAHRHKRVAQLSKGMARRLAWAQATIHQPRFLILDEPTSGLDPVGRQAMQRWIRHEKTKGTGLLLCTHELELVDALCDDFYILRQGRLVFSSKQQETPAPRYALRLSGMSEQGLRRLKTENSLPAWHSLEQEGALAVLGFADYATAALWLASSLKNHLVVVKFSDEPRLSEKDLIGLFEGNSHVASS